MIRIPGELLSAHPSEKMSLHTYLPQDRLRALLMHQSLPDRSTGAALFADISGFTSLTESLTLQLGARRGLEELTRQISAVYHALILEIERFGGSVIGFAGDSVTCWFDDGIEVSSSTRNLLLLNGHVAPLNALSAAQVMQSAMQAFPQIGLKVAIATGSIRRFLVGDPQFHYLDTLAGATVARTATGERLAKRGEILVDEATVRSLDNILTVTDWRTDAVTGERFAAAGQLSVNSDQLSVSMKHQSPDTDNSLLRPYLIPAVYEREISGQGSFLTEFRPCTVLFVRFEGIDYDLDDAQAHLDAFIRQMQVITERHQGTPLELTIGDKGSYAYINFGALGAHEDDTRRAVKTALELKDASHLPMQMGISQGVMRVGAYGGQTRRTYSAIGYDVNLAARLMEAARPGEILLGEAAYKAVATHFYFEPRPALKVKGRAEPLAVFRLLREVQTRAMRLQEPAYSLPMIGRQNELQVIDSKLALSLQGKAQVIGIVAEAGMGKSRLVAEVIRAARKEGFTCYGGACQSDGVNTPYLVWKSIWSAFFDVDPAIPLRQQIRALESSVHRLAPGRTQAIPLLGFLLNLAIPDNDFTKSLEPKYRQSALHALLEDCLRAATKADGLDKLPLLVVIEDLHWMDTLSLELLEHLARALGESRICFVLAYRPPQFGHMHALSLETLPAFTKIELTELNAAEAGQVIRAKLALLYPERAGQNDAPPLFLVDKLMERAQGNPFFLEELLNFLHDHHLDPNDASMLEKLELPDSLHTLILTRIDQLREHEKTTLRVASIVGRVFRVAWLTGYYPELGSMPQARTDLDELRTLDITSLINPEPELAYLFKHIITYEVTYENLPFDIRAHLHERLAAYIEGQITAGVLGESALLDTLVYHYSRSENRDKQRVYLRKAAQAALDASAFTTAVEYLSSLLKLTDPTDPARSRFALQLAEAHYRLGDYSAAQTATEQAQTTATSDADRAAAAAFLGEMTSGLGNYPEARSILAEAVPLARASGDMLTLCRALYALGDVNWRLGKPHEAKSALDESLALARSLGDMTRELFALTRLGSVIGQMGDLDEKERLLREVQTKALAAGNRERAMMAFNNLGVVEGARENFVAARECFRQALALAREIGAQDAIARGLSNLANEEFHLGNLSVAREGLREGLALALRLGALPWAVGTIRYFAEFCRAEGDFERALELYGLASVQPAWNSDLQKALDNIFIDWGVDPDVAKAGLARGAALDWDTTIRELLQA